MGSGSSKAGDHLRVVSQLEVWEQEGPCEAQNESAPGRLPVLVLRRVGLQNNVETPEGRAQGEWQRTPPKDHEEPQKEVQNRRRE